MNELNNDGLEQRLLGALLSDPKKFSDARVDDSLFATKENATVYNSAVVLWTVGREQTPTNIGLKAKSDSAGALAAKVMTIKSTGADFDSVVEALMDLRARRQTAASAQETYNAMHDMDEDASVAINGHADALKEIKQLAPTGAVAGGDMTDVMDNLEWRIKHPLEVRGLRFGFPQTERMLDGLQGGQFYVLGARPGVGKTAMITSMALNMMKGEKVPFIVSLEMKRALLQARILSAYSSINVGGVDAPTVKELKQIQTAMLKLKGFNWFIDDTPRMDITDICDSARRLRDTDKIDCLLIDYLQIIQNKKFKPTDMRLKVGDNCFQLKELSKELDIPVVVPAQLRRKQIFSSKGEKKHVAPDMQDLKESGDIEQDADVIMLLDRGRDEDGDFSRNIIAKNRNGETGRIEYKFEAALSRFKEV